MATEELASQKEDLLQYESRLKNISELIETSDKESLPGLLSLKEKVVELIALTKENIAELEFQTSNKIDDEFALFMSEVQHETSNESKEPEQKDEKEDGISTQEESLWQELNELVGTKCQAPFFEEWSSDIYNYHNALIMSIDPTDPESLKVKVMFTNPTSKKMIPCNYYLDGECKFSDDQCHFSHGYAVNFSDLKEYKEPNFNLIKEKAAVLVKDTDNLWKRAVVTGLIPEENQCSVKFESGRKEMTVVDIKNTLPLDEPESKSIDSNNDECSEKLKAFNSDHHAAMVEKSLTQQPLERRLGEWEKHTKSIGSKLMASMGYVVGTGLGKRGEGRVEPVAAVILPPGKSLDHCMALREAAGGDPNLFEAQKVQRKIQNQIIAKNAHRMKQMAKKPKNVFNFINDSLSESSSKPVPIQSSCIESGLKTTSAQQLNVEELKVSESIDKKKYELYVLRDSLTRQKRDTVGYNSVSKKLKQAQAELNRLQNQLKDVNKEQSYRKTMKELTKF